MRHSNTTWHCGGSTKCSINIFSSFSNFNSKILKVKKLCFRARLSSKSSHFKVYSLEKKSYLKMISHIRWTKITRKVSCVISMSFKIFMHFKTVIYKQYLHLVNLLSKPRTRVAMNRLANVIKNTLDIFLTIDLEYKNMLMITLQIVGNQQVSEVIFFVRQSK